MYFVNHDHLGDLDAHGDVLDVFDIVRLARHEAWNEPLPFADRLRAVGAGDVRDRGQTPDAPGRRAAGLRH